MHHIGTQDGSDIPSSSASRKKGRAQEEISGELAAKRARIEKQDDEAKITHALENVRKQQHRNVKLGRKCKVLPSSRLFLQQSLSKGGKYERCLAEYDRFPSKYIYLVFIL